MVFVLTGNVQANKGRAGWLREDKWEGGHAKAASRCLWRSREAGAVVVTAACPPTAWLRRTTYLSSVPRTFF